MADVGHQTPRGVRFVAISSTLVAVVLLTAATPASAPPCTHGESSMAVSVAADGQVTTLQAPHATGCTP